LLNDLFGIQVRGGCSCAGPYGHSLLGMDMGYSRAIEAEIQRGIMVMRPGWTRLNFNYFIDEGEFEYLMRAIELVASLGWRMLPFYQVDVATGVWRFNGQSAELASSLDIFSFADYCAGVRETETKTIELTGLIAAAEQVLETAPQGEDIGILKLSDESEAVRWFVLPHEV
ncbi:MAG: aminotransferase, partial [Gammaproteobacteria bacterium]|nr:aminotransferase [Gammaproteobacteria bacterium]